MKILCAFTDKKVHILPILWCQILSAKVFPFLPLSLPLSSCIKEKSLSRHFYLEPTVSKCPIQLKWKPSKIEPPFIRYGFFFLCCYSKQISCLSICLMTLIIFFQKHATPGQAHKICPKVSSCQKFSHKLFQSASRNLLSFCNDL